MGPTKIVLTILALLLVIATAIPLMRSGQWWIRAFDFPRAQFAIAGIVLLALYLYFWGMHSVFESVVFGLLSLAMAYQVVKMVPYTVLMPRQVLSAQGPSDGASLGLLIANVLMDNRQSTIGSIPGAGAKV